MENKPPLIDVKATVAAMNADAADPTPGAPVPPQAAETVPPPPAATAAPEKRGRGRPRGSSTKRGAGGKFERSTGDNSQAGGTGQSEAVTDDDELEALTPRETAALINKNVGLIAFALGGEEALPTVDEEREMNKSLAAYLKRFPDFQVRPEFLLIGAYAPYLGRALTRPQAQMKIGFGLGRLWQAIKSVAGRIFRRKGETIDATATAS